MKFTPTAAAMLAFCVLAFAATIEGQSPTPRQEHRAAVAQRLMMQAAAQGRVRVIVGLDVAARPDSALRAAERLLQRAEIDNAQAEVLDDLSGRELGRVKRFRYTPGMAVEVDYPTLQYLSTHRRVAYVIEDRLVSATLAESTKIIGAPSAWSAGYTGAGETVAIVDTGVDRTHPFLGGRVVAEACFSTTSSAYGTTEVCPSGSTARGSAAPCGFGCDHGTHVAGIAAGSGATFSGVARGASIIAIQVFSRVNATGGVSAFLSDVNLALEHVYSMRSLYNIAAVNMSLGTREIYDACDDLYPPLKATIDSLRGAGIATVVSSGNEYSGLGLSFPACISTAISVGSTEDGSSNGTSLAVPVDSISSFSNSSPALRLLAPGEWIISSIPVASGSWGNYHGTSMAAPHVTGAWAVLKSRLPSATVDDILNALSTTGLPITDPRNGVTRRRIDVFQALNALGPLCTYSINPAAIDIGAGAEDGTLFITTQAGCPWAVTGNTGFITFPAGTSGTGSGSLLFRIAANSSTSPRSGAAIIAGRTFSVKQAGACIYSISPTSINVPAAATTGTVSVTAPGVCRWDAVSSQPFISVSNGTGRAGSGTVTFSVAVNYAITARTGSLTIAGQSFAVNQGAATVDTARQARERTQADFNGDGFNDLLWQDTTNGYLAAWMLEGSHTTWSAVSFPQRILDTDWRIAGTGDFNGDGKPDIVWHHRTTGALYLWYMDGVTRIGETVLSIAGEPDTRWQVVGVGDFNDDHKPDLVWQHDTGWLTVWMMNGATLMASVDLSPARVLDADWHVVGVGDLNADDKSDLIFEHSASGELAAWLMNGTVRKEYLPFFPAAIIDRHWRLGAVLDVNGDQTPDLIWHHDNSGEIAVWYMSGTARMAVASFPAVTQPQWRLAGPK